MVGWRVWHVVNPDGTTREETEASLADLIGRGRVTGRTLIWTFGMADWQAAGQVLADWFPREGGARDDRQGGNETQAAPDTSSLNDDRQRPPHPVSGPWMPRLPRRSYVVRHWRGELSLAITFWGGGFLAAAAIALARAVLTGLDYSTAPRLLTAATAGLGVFIITASVWQMVGVWRSSGRAIKDHVSRGEMGLWAILARLAAGLGFLSLIGNSLAYTLPSVWANLQIAFGQDTTPQHVLKVLNHGTEIEISGGIDFGTASELEALLNATPGVEVVDLASPGGWVSEAEHVRDLIRVRRLATYTDADCASACTLIYMGGYPRYLGPAGKLGFHRYTFPGLTPEQDAEANQEGQQDLMRSGVNADFAAKAFSTPSEKMWEPDRATLLRAGVVTEEVDGIGFAAAATVGMRFTEERADKQLQTIASFAALKRVDPVAYTKMVTDMVAKSQIGSSWEEVMASATAALDAEVRRYRPLAGDDIQVKLAALQAEEARILAPDHPDSCVAMLYGLSERGAGYLGFLPVEIRKRDSELTGAILESGHSHPDNLMATEAEANAAVERLWSDVKLTGIDVSAVGRQPTTPDDQRSICRAFDRFFAEVALLQPDTAGPLMRYLNRP
jgi:uncharacterized protein DUF4339